MATGNAPRLGELIGRAAEGDAALSYQTLTSVFPTTTVAALGAINTGVAPVEHGLLGYTLYLPEVQMVAEMIRWGPLNRRMSFGDPRSLACRRAASCGPRRLYSRLQARRRAGGPSRSIPIGFSGRR